MFQLKQAVDAVGYVSLVAFAALALATVNQWRMRRDRAAAWTAGCFLTLGIVVVLGRILPAHPHTTPDRFFLKIEIAVLLLFPFLLYRFTTVFRATTSRLERSLGLMTLVMIVWTFALPRIPTTGQPRPAWFVAYLVGFMIHWTVLSAVAAVRLWRAGRGQPSVARKRMRFLAFASALLTVALALAIANNDQYSVYALVTSIAGVICAGAFLLGVAPPALVRFQWRRPAQERVQNAIRDLITLSRTQEEVAGRVLGPMADIVGARALAIRNAEGRIVGAYNVPEDTLAQLERGEPATLAGAETIEVGIPPAGALVVWTTPYAPFFGNDELRMLSTVGALTGLALDRVRLFQQEHEVRLALEQADELKTNFVALAAHELRTPVTTIHGLAATLHRHGNRLGQEQLTEVREMLERQAERLASLVEQLLDLSRLDADVIPIEPQRFNLRQRLEEIVATTAAESADAVDVAAPEDLEAVADPVAIERIVSNLVTNALRYGSPPVIINAAQSDRHLRIAVEDRGDGVPAQFVPDLFERFTRETAARERAGGTGLGLAIARSYARAHRGDLVYEDAEPRGARFQLILPAENDVEAHRRRRAEVGAGGFEPP